MIFSYSNWPLTKKIKTINLFFPQNVVIEHKKLVAQYQQAKQEIQYSQSTLSRVEMELEKVKQELQQSHIKFERATQSMTGHEHELRQMEQEVEAWKEKYRRSEQDVITAEDGVQKAEDENKRLKYLIQEQDATKERLISAGADYERQEEKYTNEIERLQVINNLTLKNSIFFQNCNFTLGLFVVP